MFGPKYLCLVAFSILYIRFVVSIEDIFPRSVFVECLKEHNMTEEQEKELRVNSPDEYYCLYSCYFKKLEYMDKDGMIHLEKLLLKLTKNHGYSEEEIKRDLPMWKKCSNINEEVVSDGEKGCERAKLFMICMEP